MSLLFYVMMPRIRAAVLKIRTVCFTETAVSTYIHVYTASQLHLSSYFVILVTFRETLTD
jgi:hypothetical protein